MKVSLTHESNKFISRGKGPDLFLKLNFQNFMKNHLKKDLKSVQ